MASHRIVLIDIQLDELGRLQKLILPSTVKEIQKQIQLEDEDECKSPTSGNPSTVEETQAYSHLEK